MCVLTYSAFTMTGFSVNDATAPCRLAGTAVSPTRCSAVHAEPAVEERAPIPEPGVVERENESRRHVEKPLARIDDHACAIGDPECAESFAELIDRKRLHAQAGTLVVEHEVLPLR